MVDIPVHLPMSWNFFMAMGKPWGAPWRVAEENGGMNIVFMTSSRTKSGGSRQALYLARALVRRGHDLTFLAPENSTLPSLAGDLPWEYLPRNKHKWKNVVRATLARKLPVVWHVFHNKAVKKAAWWGLLWRRKPLVVLAQRGVVFPPNNFLPYVSPGIDCFVANSEACARVLARRGVSKKRLAVVYNAVPQYRITPLKTADQVREELGLGKDSFLLGAVGYNNPNKGMDKLIEAFAIANAPGRLVLVGPDEARFGPMAEAMGVRDRVVFTGETESVADYLQILDAFALPSLSESMPNTLMEAIFLGLPVIATRTGGVPELVEGNGLLVAPGDVPGLAGGIRELALNVEQRSAWAEQSRVLARKFSIDAKAERMETLYSDLLGRKGVAP